MELYHLTWSISTPGIRIGLSKPLNWVLSTHLAASLKNLRNHPFTNHFINMCPTTVRWDYLNIWYPKKSRLHHHIMIKQNTYWLPLFIIKVEASSSSTYIYHKNTVLLPQLPSVSPFSLSWIQPWPGHPAFLAGFSLEQVKSLGPSGPKYPLVI
jgi:hypothetical protein